MKNEFAAKISHSGQSAMQRVATLDFQRGLAIWMMVFLHVFNHIYDYSWVDIDTLFDGSVPYLLAIFLVIIAFLGSWAGYFVLISGIVTTMSTVKSVLGGKEVGGLVIRQLTAGVGILLAGYITEAFGYYGYFGTSIREAQLLSIGPFLWRRMFIMEALQIIGYTYIINAIVIFFLSRRGGVNKFARNIIIYALLTLLVFALTPVVWNWVDNMAWDPKELTGYHATWPSEILQYENASPMTYFLTVLAGDLYPIFPFLTTTFIGAMIGLILAMPSPPKRYPHYIAAGNALILVAALAIMFFGSLEITFERPSMGYYLLLLWTQVTAVNILLWVVEYRGNSQKFGDHWLVTYFRRWGLIPMTIFALQIWSLAPRILFNFAVPGYNLVSERLPYSMELVVLIFAIITVLFYDLLIWLWGKVNYAGSFEWIILRISSRGRRSKMQRLNFDKMLNHVKWSDIRGA
jgi:hypothetical protein